MTFTPLLLLIVVANCKCASLYMILIAIINLTYNRSQNIFKLYYFSGEFPNTTIKIELDYCQQKMHVQVTLRDVK